MIEVRRTLSALGIDLVPTLATQGTYPADPTHRWYDRGFERAVLTPHGPGTMRLDWTDPTRVEAVSWGDGANWLAERAPDWLGLQDDPSVFDPAGHPAVERWWRTHGRFRLGRSGVIWQEIALAVLGQRVTTKDAVASWSQLCRHLGEPAPGPSELRLPPTPEAVAAMDLAAFHRIGVERGRAETLRLAARRANRLEEAASMPAPEALTRLTALPGLGIWTATTTITISHGDADMVILRDHGLPTMVNFAFTGDSAYVVPDGAGDELMLQHLEPWRGQRQRVIRLLFAAGVRVPRRSSKRGTPDIRRI